MPAFTGAHHANASDATFNDVGQNQYNLHTTNIQISSSARLAQAFSSAQLISSMVSHVEMEREQMKVLANSVNTLLRTLDAEYSAGRLIETTTSAALDGLNDLLNEIAVFAEKQSDADFMKSLSMHDERPVQIESFYRQIDIVVASFQISSLVGVQDWQVRNESARRKDTKALHDRLRKLESDHLLLREMLNSQHCSIMTMMLSFQRMLEQQSLGPREHQFFSHSVRYLSTVSGRQVRVEDWMITTFEVEFGSEIGSGGFARVFEGTWNKTRVALKVFRAVNDVIPRSEAIEHEVAIWSKLSHPHILQFLGANVLDRKPFIVTPLMLNGNARTYIQNHPECNRLKILYHISLGLVYLHSKNIVHGDIKAHNVLIDGEGNAVVGDFGLARLRADVTSRTKVIDVAIVAGSRNWMAPELLMGGSLKKPSDIYSFGLTVYEIYTGNTPLGHCDPGEIRELVFQHDVRPDRPEQHEAPQLTNDIWNLAELCWVKDPSGRPTVITVCDVISGLLENHPGSPPANSELPGSSSRSGFPNTASIEDPTSLIPSISSPDQYGLDNQRSSGTGIQPVIKGGAQRLDTPTNNTAHASREHPTTFPVDPIHHRQVSRKAAADDRLFVSKYQTGLRRNTEQHLTMEQRPITQPLSQLYGPQLPNVPLPPALTSNNERAQMQNVIYRIRERSQQPTVQQLSQDKTLSARQVPTVPPPVGYNPTDDQLFETDQAGCRRPNAEFLKHHFLREGRLTETQALYILDQATILLSKEPNIVDVESPIIICGDIHGQYYDLMTLFEMGGDINDNSYLFLGDYVDRGCFGIECLLYLYALKLWYPTKLTLLRGNHECEHLTDYFTFKRECLHKYSARVYGACLKSFCALPVTALVDGRFFCVHGGISPELITLEDIHRLDRFKEPGSHGLLCDLLWADPIVNYGHEHENSISSPGLQPGTMFQHNASRGCSYFFTYEAACKFLERNDLLAIIRGHEAQDAGYTMHRKTPTRKFPSVITIFSAPNYLDVYHNRGAILKYAKNNITIRQYNSSSHPYWLPNFMDAFAWSFPFVGAKIAEMLLAILAVCTEEELETTSEDDEDDTPEHGLRSDDVAQRKQQIKDKILAVENVQRVFQLLREGTENVSELSATTDTGAWRSMDGEGGNDLSVQGNQIRRNIHNFDDARRSDRINERRPRELKRFETA